MKKLLIIPIVACLWLQSCDDPDTKDPFEGRWEYHSSDITVEFSLLRASSTYNIENIRSGADTWTSSVVKDVVVGHEIGSMSVSENITGVAFFNSTIDGSTMRCDSVMYMQGTNKKWSYNQTLTKK